jgi:hypothetical protein
LLYPSGLGDNVIDGDGDGSSVSCVLEDLKDRTLYALSDSGERLAEHLVGYVDVHGHDAVSKHDTRNPASWEQGPEGSTS